jgi:hypothetical protein
MQAVLHEVGIGRVSVVVVLRSPAPAEGLPLLLGVLRQALPDDLARVIDVIWSAFLVRVPAVQIGLAFEVVCARLIGGEHRLAGGEERRIQGFAAVLTIVAILVVVAAHTVLPTDAHILLIIALHGPALGTAVTFAAGQKILVQG